MLIAQLVTHSELLVQVAPDCSECSESQSGILHDIELLDVLTQSQVILRQLNSHICQVLKEGFNLLPYLCISWISVSLRSAFCLILMSQRSGHISYSQWHVAIAIGQCYLKEYFISSFPDAGRC